MKIVLRDWNSKKRLWGKWLDEYSKLNEKKEEKMNNFLYDEYE